MRRLLPFLFMLSILGPLSVHAQKQKGNKPPKNPVKQAGKEEQDKEKSLDKEIKALKKEFEKAQSKSTRKQMKRLEKDQRRHARHRKPSLWQRIFRKDPRKKGRKRK